MLIREKFEDETQIRFLARLLQNTIQFTGYKPNQDDYERLDNLTYGVDDEPAGLGGEE